MSRKLSFLFASLIPLAVADGLLMAPAISHETSYAPMMMGEFLFALRILCFALAGFLFGQIFKSRFTRREANALVGMILLLTFALWLIWTVSPMQGTEMFRGFIFLQNLLNISIFIVFALWSSSSLQPENHPDLGFGPGLARLVLLIAIGLANIYLLNALEMHFASQPRLGFLYIGLLQILFWIVMAAIVATFFEDGLSRKTSGILTGFFVLAFCLGNILLPYLIVIRGHHTPLWYLSLANFLSLILSYGLFESLILFFSACRKKSS